jgi:hypothetical protein
LELSTEEEARLIRFLLKDLPEDECQKIEQRYFQEDSYYEAVEALQTQLVRDYLAGSLTPKQAAQFEGRLYDDPALWEQVAVIQRAVGMTGMDARTIEAPKAEMGHSLYSRPHIYFALAAFGGCLVGLAVVVGLSHLRAGSVEMDMAALREHSIGPAKA